MRASFTAILMANNSLASIFLAPSRFNVISLQALFRSAAMTSLRTCKGSSTALSSTRTCTSGCSPFEWSVTGIVMPSFYRGY